MSVSQKPIGVNLADVRREAKAAIRWAGEHGFQAIEVPAGAGALSPESLADRSARRHLQKFVGGLGLQMASLSADMPGTRLTDPATAQQRIDQTLRILEMATDIGVPVVTTAVGAMTHPDTGEPSPLAAEGLQHIAARADALGRVLAIRPSYDSPEHLRSMLDAIGCPSLKLGFDPAAMAIVGKSPLKMLEKFPLDIAMVHARDATAGGAQRAGQETALGEGDLDYVTLLAMLEATEYAGSHILRRMDSQRPDADLMLGRERLRGWLTRGQ